MKSDKLQAKNMILLLILVSYNCLVFHEEQNFDEGESQ